MESIDNVLAENDLYIFCILLYFLFVHFYSNFSLIDAVDKMAQKLHLGNNVTMF